MLSYSGRQRRLYFNCELCDGSIHFVQCFHIFHFVVNTQVRFAHTDLTVPDFSPYRRTSTKNENRKNNTAADRNAFTYLLVGGK